MHYISISEVKIKYAAFRKLSLLLCWSNTMSSYWQVPSLLSTV